MLAEIESEAERRYRLFREEQAAELERAELERIETLYSAWTCGCGTGVLCPDHAGPLQEGQTRSQQGGKNERNPAGASLVVMREIRRCFPDQADDILRALRWQGGFDPMWSFVRWGHYVGVELDGYIHS